MKNELFLYANYYHKIGMNISPVKCDDYKGPLIEDWEKYILSRQGDEEIQSYDWIEATGIGVILGYNEYRALDVDSLCCSLDDQYSEETRVERKRMFISQCLEILGLPQNYCWVIDSGSGNDLHIIFRSSDFVSSSCDYSYSPNAFFKYEVQLFERMEIRWKAFLVLPPSLHKSGGKYLFHDDMFPLYKPYYISLDKIYDLINYFCGDLSFKRCYFRKQYSLYLAKIKKKEAESSFTRMRGDILYEVKDNIDFLKSCHSKDAFNTLGVYSAVDKTAEDGLSKALKFFYLSNNSMAHFNIASLMACGAIDGTEQEILYHLDFCKSFPDDKKDLVKSNLKKRMLMSDKKIIKYLFFDTETTGIPADYNASSSDFENWPRLVQLSWIITDNKGVVISKHTHIIYPDGFIIPEDVSNLHAITTIRAKEQGESIIKVLDLFTSDVNQVNYLVGHNISFDKKIVGAELVRIGRFDIMDSKPSYCTMKLSTDYCQILGLYGYKYPQLQELYKKLFGSNPDGVHDASVDVDITMKCFWEMCRLGIISISESSEDVGEL